MAPWHIISATRVPLFFILLQSCILIHQISIWLVQTLLETASLPRALGPRQRPINPRQRLCRGRSLAKSSRGILSRRRGCLPRALYRALGKEKQPSRRRRLGRSLCRGLSPGALGKDFFFEKSLPRASKHGSRQRNVQNFSKKIFAEGHGTALGKELFFFFEKSLPRASTQALGKGIFFF